MTRKFLEDMGLEKDAIDKIMAENGSDIENARNSEKGKFDNERTALQGQLTDLQGQIDQRNTDISNLQASLTAAQADASKLTDIQTELSGLQSKYEADQAAWAQKTAQQAYEFAVRERANALNFSSKAAKQEFIREAIGKEFKSENGVLLGFDDYVNVYKESDPGAFVVETPAAPAQPATPPGPIVLPGTGGSPVPVKHLSDMMKAKNENPEMVISFNK